MLLGKILTEDQKNGRAPVGSVEARLVILASYLKYAVAQMLAGPQAPGLRCEAVKVFGKPAIMLAQIERKVH